MDALKLKIQTMFETQNELNKVVHPEWEKQKYPWEDAIMCEAIELFDHFPWKWWKKHTKPVDIEQARLEAIDIWHFIMSRLIEDLGIELAINAVTKVFEFYTDLDEENVPDISLIGKLSTIFINETTAFRINPSNTALASYFGTFSEILFNLGITPDALYTTYVAKTQLNRLRWANGYGTTYLKMWDGQEDNVWLANYVKTLDVNAPDFKDQVATGLAFKYASVEANFVGSGG